MPIMVDGVFSYNPSRCDNSAISSSRIPPPFPAYLKGRIDICIELLEEFQEDNLSEPRFTEVFHEIRGILNDPFINTVEWQLSNSVMYPEISIMVDRLCTVALLRYREILIKSTSTAIY